MVSRFLGGSPSRLEAAVYEVSGYYAFLFRLAALRGTRTRLLLDAHPGPNSTTARILRSGPARCRLLRGEGGGTAHWKLLLADDRVAVGTGNLIKRDAPRPVPPTEPPSAAGAGARGGEGGGWPPGGATAAPGTREWWAVVGGGPLLAARARLHFEDRWDGALPAPEDWPRSRPRLPGRDRPTAPPVGVPVPVVAPLTIALAGSRLRLVIGGSTAGTLLAEVAASSLRRLDVTVPYVHSGAPAARDLLSALRDARRRGARVRLLLGGAPAPRDVAALRSFELDARVMDPARSTTGHAKGMVADDRAVLGSANWSGPGLGGNLEASLLVDHPAPAGYFAAAFERDWGVALSLERAGLAGRARGYALAAPARLELE